MKAIRPFISLLLVLCMLLSASCIALAEGESFSFISTEPNTLNLLQSQSNLDEYVFYLTSATLYRSVNGEMVPELCENLTISEDNCTFTYTLKEASYSDGTPITAADFVYYLTKSAWLSMTGYKVLGADEAMAGGECAGIYAPDEKTLVIQLEAPDVAFDPELQVYPLNQAFAESKGDALGGTPADLQYSGPYELTEWIVGDSMTFVKNESYINAETSFPVEELRLVVSTDTSTTYSLYASGEVDALISVNSELRELLDPNEISSYSSGNLYGLEFNTTGFTYTEGDGFVSRGEEVTALMKNKNFRYALAAALDREAIVAALEDSGTPTNRYVPSRMAGTGETSYVEEYPLETVIPLTGDIEAAKNYLAAALEELGYSDVSELPQISFLTFENDKQSLMVEIITSLWKSELGLTNISITLKPIQSAIMSMVFMDFDIYLQQLTIDPDNPLEQLDYWTTAGGVSDPAGFQASGAPAEMTSMHANSEYDELVTKLHAEFDDATRFAGMVQAEQILYSDMVYFPLMEGMGYQALKPYVQGFISPYEADGYDVSGLSLEGK